MAGITELLKAAKAQAGISDAPANPEGGMPNAQMGAYNQKMGQEKMQFDMYKTLRDSGYDTKSAWEATLKKHGHKEPTLDPYEKARTDYYSRLSKEPTDDSAQTAIELIKNAGSLSMFGGKPQRGQILEMLMANKMPLTPEVMAQLDALYPEVEQTQQGGLGDIMKKMLLGPFMK